METLVSTILPKIENLKIDDSPIFGLMGPQHMVEHLLLIVKISNGRLQSPLLLSEEKAKMYKAFLIDSDNEFPLGFKAPSLPIDSVLPLKYPDIETAKQALRDSLDAFVLHFKDNPDLKIMHPTMGILNYNEWVIFHTKHFTHHFKQFNLI